MSRFPEPSDPANWQPATSRPGELYTIEGQIRASGSFARGLKNRNPRLKAYRRSMRHTALAIIGFAVLLFTAIAALQQLA